MKILLLAKVAWNHPPTVRGYERLVRRRAIWLIGMVAGVAVAMTCLGLHLTPPALPFIGCLFAISFLPVTVIIYVRRKRVAAVLQAYPWCEVSARHDPRRAAILSLCFRGELTLVFRMFPHPTRLTSDDFPDLVWFAGDPRFGGVVSPVGGHRPVRVVPDTNTAPGATDGWIGGDDELARKVGIVRRSGKATQS
ncbi:hypothetical protein J7E97_20360 [Streptomyces sp. ISL-66]|uniref:hypothetical protein n=1 Tax=Streptomyces sp. ISL-66 TaxID=2819186 RepID=UPI001BE7F9FB|nr:hypothetical protein [Streptomyces sp. ISL-66]MBT2470164.1 hypothetical protein [Streptomyces sp. ISL-66]